MEEAIRALGRAKREAETPPLVFTAENRDRVTFFLAIAAVAVTLVTSIITAAIVIDRMRTDVTTNKTELATVRADAVVAKDLAKRVEEEQVRRKEPLEQVVRKKAELDQYDLKEINALVRDLVQQRGYGINNDLWYMSAHNGFRPPTVPAPSPK